MSKGAQKESPSAKICAPKNIFSKFFYTFPYLTVLICALWCAHPSETIGQSRGTENFSSRSSIAASPSCDWASLIQATELAKSVVHLCVSPKAPRVREGIFPDFSGESFSKGALDYSPVSERNAGAPFSLGPAIPMTAPAPPQAKILGCGFFLSLKDDHGVILTNYHVVQSHVEKGWHVSVMLPWGKSVSGTVAHQDPAWDIALVRVSLTAQDAKNLRVLPWSQDDILLGQEVLGASYDESGAFMVSPGAISCLAYRLKITNAARNFELPMVLTTVCALPGHSGGPLINAKGHIVGIITALRDRAGFSGALGARDAQRRIHLWTMGRPHPRSVLGIRVKSLTEETFTSQGPKSGLVVVQVLPKHLAYGRIFVGDIILSLNTVPTPNVQELAQAMELAQSETTGHFRIWRSEKDGSKGRIVSLEVPLRMPLDTVAHTQNADTPETLCLAGLSLASGTSSTQSYPQNPEAPEDQGLQVLSVDKSSPFFQVLRPGDRVIMFHGNAMHHLASFLDVLIQALKTPPKSPLIFTIFRSSSQGGAKKWIAWHLPKNTQSLRRECEKISSNLSPNPSSNLSPNPSSNLSPNPSSNPETQESPS